MKFIRLFTLSLIFSVLFIVISCEPEVIGNITPTADLIFQVTDDQGNPVADAVVYIFPFKSNYDDYVASNPDGNDQVTPTLSAQNVGVTDGNGEALFANYVLEGNSFASGSTFINRPNPLYVRIQAEGSTPGTFITNDSDLFKITFDELESGDFIVEEIPVVLD